VGVTSECAYWPRLTALYILQDLPNLAMPYPPVSSDPRKLSDPEQALINAIDWLTFHESTYRDAIVRINAVLRYFLGESS
jgi:hypothetical protein